MHSPSTVPSPEPDKSSLLFVFFIEYNYRDYIMDNEKRTGHVACMGEMRNAYRNLVMKCQNRRLLGNLVTGQRI